MTFIIKKAVDITQAQADDYITIVDGTLRDLSDKINDVYKAYQQGEFYNKTEIGNILNQRSFNVKQYGAVGDGVTDDSDVFNQVIQLASKVKGSLWVPYGTYLLQKDLIFASDVTFNMDRNAMIYAPGQFFRFDTSTKGYGGGVKNVVVHGGTFSGDYDAENVINGHTSFNAFNGALHHAENIEFDNVTFRMTTANSHTLDLGGCKDIYIHDCIFEGFKPAENREYVEAIQIDYSTKTGLTFHDENQDNNIDGLPTIDVTVHNNIFRPIYNENDGSIKYFAPNVCGEHVAYANGEPTNIEISGNKITDGYVFRDENFDRGWIHFHGGHNIKIVDNSFEETQAQKVMPIQFHADIDDDGLTDAVSGNKVVGTYSYHSGIVIANNHFSGFNYDYTVNGGIITFYGNPNVGSDDITINDNCFENMLPINAWSKDGPGIDSINGVDFKRVIINNNEVKTARRLIYLAANHGSFDSIVTVSGNNLNSIAYLPLALNQNGPSSINVYDNIISDSRGGILVWAEESMVNLTNNNVILKTDSKMTGQFSNDSITVNSSFASITNNAVVQGNDSNYQYSYGFNLSKSPINWDNNYFNGSNISNIEVPKDNNIVFHRRLGANIKLVACPDGTNIGTFLKSSATPKGFNIIRDDNSNTDIMVYKEDGNYGWALKLSAVNGSFQKGYWSSGTWNNWSDV